MKKTLLTLSLCFPFIINVLAATQNSRTDSLKAILTTPISDSLRINVLLKISDKLGRSHTNESYNYALEALQLSKKINNDVDIADSYDRLAALNIYKNKFDSTIFYSNRALKIYKKLKLKDGQVNSYNNLMVVEYYRGNTTKAIEIAKKTIPLNKETKNINKEAKLYNNIGLMYSNQGQYDSALVYTFKSLPLLKKVGDSVNYNGAIINIGGYYLQLDDSANMIHYIRAGIKNCKQYADRRGLAICYSNLSQYYIKYQMLDSAFYIVNKCIALDRELHDDYGLAVDIKTIAMIFKNQGKYHQAIDKLKECAIIQNKMKNMHGLMLTNYELADNYFLLKDYSKAKHYALLSLEASRSMEAKDSEQKTLETLSNIYFLTNNYLDAYKSIKQSHQIKDSIFNIEKSELIEELNIKYETAQKEQENLNLSHANEIKDSKLLHHRKMRYIYWLIIGLSSVFIIIVLWILKKKNEAYKYLVQKNIEYSRKEEELRKIKIQQFERNMNATKQCKYSEDKKEELLSKIEYEFANNKVFTTNISLSELANIVNTNTTYLSEIINKSYNKTFSDFVNHYRVQEVIRLMQSDKYSSYTIEAISEMAGFSSPKTFYRAFKKNTGLTPSFYKKNIQTM